jgi:hypothetical protein
MTTLISTAPTVYAALLGLIQQAALQYLPPIQVFPAELLEYQPGSYIIVGSVENHQFDPEATQYTFLEHYDINGLCTVFAGDVGGESASDIMTATYNLFTNIVGATVVEHRGGNGIPVLGITSYPSPYEIKFGYARYIGSPGNIGGAQAGWQGTINWSFALSAYLSSS